VRCSGLVELLQTKLRKIIIGLFSVRTTENNSYVPYSPCVFFSIGAYLFAVRANAEYHYAIKTGLLPSLSVKKNF